MSIGNTARRVPDVPDDERRPNLDADLPEPEPTAFYDCMTFFDRRRGLALSDPINGRFRILATNDGGRSWQIVDADMPPALPGEFAFAASGQCSSRPAILRRWHATMTTTTEPR